MKYLIYINILLIITVTAGCSAKEKNSKEISIAYPNWSEGIALSYLAKNILEEQGYKVTMQNADIAPIFVSMARGKTDVFMDTWLPVTHKDYMNQYGEKLDIIGKSYNNARIGLVVPTYVSINSIEELNKNHNQFSGEIIGIDAGAGIMKSTIQAIADYPLDIELRSSSGTAMTALLKKATDAKKWIVITGWQPHWMFSVFDLKFLDDPKKSFGEAESIFTISRKGFSADDPFAGNFFSNLKLNDEQLSSLLNYFNTISDETEAANKWIYENRELVDSWISGKQ